MADLATDLHLYEEKSVPTTPATVITDGSPCAPSRAASAASEKAASVGVIVQAPAANTIPVYVGPAGVTTGTGLELVPGAAILLPVASQNLLYCVAASSGQKLRILKLV